MTNEDYKRRIFELTGAISGCWSNLQGAGEFQSGRATALTESIITLFQEQKEEMLKKILRSQPLLKLERWTVNIVPVVDEKAIAYNNGVKDFIANLKENNLWYEEPTPVITGEMINKAAMEANRMQRESVGLEKPIIASDENSLQNKEVVQDPEYFWGNKS